MNIILEKLKLFIIYSSASAMYAAANVEKIKACTEPAKIPNNIIGNGITNGTREVNTVTVSSSANTLPNNRKLNDNGFVKSSKMLIGRRSGSGLTYRLKYPKPFLLKPA